MAVKMIIRTKGEKELPEPSQVVVREQLGQPITFSITYAEDVCEGDFKLLVNQAIDPLQEIEILVRDGDSIFYLVKGMVQSQQISFKHGGQGSQLTVSGSDNSIRMDWVTETKKWGKKLDQAELLALMSGINKHPQDEEERKEGLPHIARNYPFIQYNIMGGIFKAGEDEAEDINATEPADEEENEGPSLEFQEGRIQRGSDLQFIKQIAEQKKMYFWVSYQDDQGGGEIANFNSLPIEEASSAELIINHENNNIDAFELNYDVDRPTSAESYQIDKRNKSKKEEKPKLAPQPKLSQITLADLTANTISAMLPPIADEDSLQERSEAALNETEWFIKASCSTTYERLNQNCTNGNGQEPPPPKIIHAHKVVDVVGIGSRHSGRYVVSGVTHTLDRESYKMQIELMRNSWNDPVKRIMDWVTALVNPFSNEIEAFRENNQ